MAYLGREAAKAPIVTADLPDNGVSLAKMTGGTDGNIISYDASGNPVAIATGSDGQVLTSTGAGSPPAFEAVTGGGKVGQMIQVVKTDTASIASSTPAAISGMTKNITCVATSSKVRIQAVCNIGSSANGYGAIYLYKGGSVLAAAAAASAGDRLKSSAASTKMGSTLEMSSQVIDYIDSPSSTSEVTYAIYWSKGAEIATIYLNSTSNDADNANHVRGISTLTLTEILA